MPRHTKRNGKNRNKKRHGGAATVLPLSYFDGKAPDVSAAAGRDLLRASGLGVRPAIGPVSSYSFNIRGGRCGTRRSRKGGFTPSVMGNFPQLASRYIVPMTLYAGYKMLKKSQQKPERRTRRRR